jgi:hypothetical protein
MPEVRRDRHQVVIIRVIWRPRAAITEGLIGGGAGDILEDATGDRSGPSGRLRAIAWSSKAANWLDNCASTGRIAVATAQYGFDRERGIQSSTSGERTMILWH